MNWMHQPLELVGIAGLMVAAGYEATAFLAVLTWALQPKRLPPRSLPAVTILKPLCGAEPGLYENLRSFCVQQYHDFQIVFGVSDPSDPALSVVKQLRAEFPNVSMDVVVEPQQHGSNRKVSSLINMLRSAVHDVLIIADSDASVGPKYIAAVTGPLSQTR